LAQIRPVTSEALESRIRSLLPSQNGFGEDLQAQNVIVPVVDLTAAAEGSGLPDYLQTSMAFVNNTPFSISGGTTVIQNTPGFWRVFGAVGLSSLAAGAVQASFSMTDGLTIKTMWGLDGVGTGTDALISEQFDFMVFLRAGDSISATSNNAAAVIRGSVRQIATPNGTLVDPEGYQPQ
jgi:hypothetical protein